MFIEGLDGKSLFLVIPLKSTVKIDYRLTFREKIIENIEDNKVIINGALEVPAGDNWLQTTLYYKVVKDNSIVMLTINDISQSEAM